MRSALVVFAATALLAACLQRGVVTCDDGRLCPVGTVCDDLHARCVAPAQLTACGGAADHTPCDLGTAAAGVCHDDVCLPAGCGDGFAEGAERCDGLELPDGDDCRVQGFHDPGPVQCAADCTYDVSECTRHCGDGVVDPEEDCDAAVGQRLGDCTSLGFYRPGDVVCNAVCRFDVAACAERCGDGVVNGDEVCDGASSPDHSCVDFGFDRGRLGCALCGPRFDACERLGWFSVPVPSGRVIDIHGVADGDRWTLGIDNGTAWLRHDAGVTSEVATPPLSDPRVVWAVADQVLVGGGAGGVATFSGGAWSVATGFAADVLWARAPDDVYAGGAGGVWHFDGATWQPLPVQPTGGAVRSITGRGPLVWVATDRIQRWEGGAWITEAYPFGPPISVWAAPDMDRLVIGTRMAILTTPYELDGCDSFTFLGSPLGPNQLAAVDIAGRSGSDVVVATARSGPGYRKLVRWDGSCWRLMRPPLGDFDVPAVWRDHDSVYVGGSALLRASGDWTQVISSSQVIPRLWSSPDDIIGAISGDFSGGFGGTVSLERDWFDHNALPADEGLWALDRDTMWGLADGMLSWWDGNTVRSAVPPGPPSAVWASGLADVWIAGAIDDVSQTPAIWSFDGATFTERFRGSAGRGPVRDLHGGGGGLWAVGDAGLVVRAVGGIWEEVSPPADVRLHAVWSWGPDDALVVGASGTIARYHAGAWTMEPTSTLATLRDVWAVTPTDVFAVGEQGTVLHHGGVGWTSVRSPSVDTVITVAAQPGVLVIADASGANYFLHRLESWSEP